MIRLSAVARLPTPRRVEAFGLHGRFFMRPEQHREGHHPFKAIGRFQVPALAIVQGHDIDARLDNLLKDAASPCAGSAG